MKLFREHRGGLQESLDTTIQVSYFEEVKRSLLEKYCEFNLTQIHIQQECIYDDRLPNEWNGIEFIVLGDIDGIRATTLGFVNFYE